MKSESNEKQQTEKAWSFFQETGHHRRLDMFSPCCCGARRDSQVVRFLLRMQEARVRFPVTPQVFFAFLFAGPEKSKKEKNTQPRNTFCLAVLPSHTQTPSPCRRPRRACRRSERRQATATSTPRRTQQAEAAHERSHHRQAKGNSKSNSKSKGKKQTARAAAARANSGWAIAGAPRREIPQSDRRARKSTAP